MNQTELPQHPFAQGNGSERPLPTSTLTTTPLPASTKVYVTGEQDGVAVPMREIALTSRQGNGTSGPDSITVYDTSGPYTDPALTLNVRRGIPPLRRQWILSRNDVEELPDVSSEYGRLRANDPKFAGLRFAHVRKPLRAKSGGNVTQMSYARKGIITPEMEFIAIRETQLRKDARRQSHETARGRSNIPDKPGALACLTPSPRTSSEMKSPGAGPSSPPTSTIRRSSR